MALIDEGKLQGNIDKLVNLLTKQVQCCRVVSAVWASSSIIGARVFVTINESGGIVVYDHPGGTVLEPANYGVLTHP